VTVCCIQCKDCNGAVTAGFGIEFATIDRELVKRLTADVMFDTVPSMG
jgi:hypothetical protein